MGEYYCPNCGADLGRQRGFDPDNGVWTCKKCGQTLYGDDVADTMEEFDDVVWYCDSCGAVLSMQSGFSDDCGTWRCKKCGYQNNISEDEIYDSEEEYQNSTTEYFCPNCNADLGSQDGFDPGLSIWTCENCGKTLYGDDVADTMEEFDDVVWYCDSCNDILNKQSGFHDDCGTWRCKKCGYQNNISEDEIYDSEEEYQNSTTEYFCPNCNADLGSQDGFDPGLSIWTCENCGKTLYGNDVEKTMKRFDGVVWYCDSCGAVLSIQPGFKDDCGTWCCRKCGCRNNISEDEIYDSEEDYQNNENEEEYTCPCCGATLNEQDSFDEDDDTHICEECDTELIKDDNEYIPLYTEEDSDEDIASEDSTASNVKKSTNQTNNTTRQSNSSTKYENKEQANTQNHNSQKTQKQDLQKINQAKEKTFFKKHWKIFLAALLIIGLVLFGTYMIPILVIAVVLFGLYRLYTKSKLITVVFSADGFVNMDYESAVHKLKDSGFSNIHTLELYDLDYTRKKDFGLVAAVSISDNEHFNSQDKFPNDSHVIVKYHSLLKKTAPVSAKEAIDKQYQDIVKQFSGKGFGNIIVTVDYDLTTGWIKNRYDIKRISINGDSSFDKDTIFTVDSRIEIVYHDFKKNKPQN